MIYTELTKKAMQVAYKAHHGQVDREGLPYIHHPIHLAEQMKTEDTCVVALLHDVLEDTDMTLEELANEGFTDAQLEAVKLMTHIPPKGKLSEEELLQDYFNYVAGLKENDIARTVKIADLLHNSDESRLSEIKEIDIKRKAKYRKALEMLLM